MLHFLIIILSYITYFCYYLKKYFNLESPEEGTGRINPPPTKNQGEKGKKYGKRN
jgi:hypothetical protein